LCLNVRPFLFVKQMCVSLVGSIDGKEDRLKCTETALVASLCVYYSGIIVFVCAGVCVFLHSHRGFPRLLVGDQSLPARIQT